MCPSSLDESEEAVCMDDEDDNEDFHQGFAAAMQHQGQGSVPNASLAKPTTPELLPLPVEVKNTKSSDSIDEPLDGTAHSMRQAVLEASTALEVERHRRAQEEMRREEAKSKPSAGLSMRRGGGISAEAVKQFVVQQQMEEQKKANTASKRSGRRHSRKKTSSDLRGMFGGPGSDEENLSASTRPARKGVRRKSSLSSVCEQTAVGPKKQNILPPVAQLQPPIGSDLPELPIVRNATKPGQFRKTTYDPFSLAIKKEPKGGGGAIG